MIDKPILITGCARSGTSLTAGVISLCGAWGGKVQGPNGNNARGMFENLEIRTNVTKKILRALGADPLGQNPLPNIDKAFESADKLSPQVRSAILGIISTQGLTNGIPWYYKGPKMCLAWPIWHDAFPRARWVIVRRDDYDVCSSCLRTNFMRAFHKRAGWKFWVEEHKRRFEEMKAYELDIIEFWPFEAIDGKLTKTRKMIDDLGLTWNAEEVRNFIAPDLWHFKEEGGI